MRIKAYIQVSKNGKIAISRKPHKQPLHNSGYKRYRKYYPTVQFIVNFEFSESIFQSAIKELRIALERPEVLSKIEIEEGETKR